MDACNKKEVIGMPFVLKLAIFFFSSAFALGMLSLATVFTDCLASSCGFFTWPLIYIFQLIMLLLVVAMLLSISQRSSKALHLMRAVSTLMCVDAIWILVEDDFYSVVVMYLDMSMSLCFVASLLLSMVPKARRWCDDSYCYSK